MPINQRVEEAAKQASEACVGRKATPDELAAMNYQSPSEPRRAGTENPRHEILPLKDDIERLIKASATNKAILDQTQISLSGLVDVVRLLLDERRELLEEK